MMNHNEKTEEILSKMFSKYPHFLDKAEDMLNADSMFKFETAFEELLKLDKRSLYFFLCLHRDDIKKEYISRAQLFFNKEISPDFSIA